MPRASTTCLAISAQVLLGGSLPEMYRGRSLGIQGLAVRRDRHIRSPSRQTILTVFVYFETAGGQRGTRLPLGVKFKHGNGLNWKEAAR
jgi:hypothetical protein